MTVDLARPVCLILFALIPLWWWWTRPDRRRSLLIAQGREVTPVAVRRPLGAAIESAPKALTAATFACLILALCQPRTVSPYWEKVQYGAGIVIAIDLSTSMLAKDMAQGTTRLQAAKASTLRFIRKRAGNVGLVVFSGEAMTRLPLTADRFVAASAVRALETGLLRDGTDIAGATVAAGSLFRDAPQRSRVVILLTDGAHNKPGLEPAEAARAVAAFGVRVHAIALGAGKSDDAQVAAMETVLAQTARISGGRYFRAKDTAALDDAYREIDRQTGGQSSRLVQRVAFQSIAYLFLLMALVLVVAATLLRGSRWGVIP